MTCALPANASPANHRSAYATGLCRCEEKCKPAKAAYMRELRAKRGDA